MMAEGCNDLGMLIEAENSDEAIAEMKREIPKLMYMENEWNLYLVVRDEFPELHNAVDETGPHHTVFVYNAKLDEDGNVIAADNLLFDETITLEIH